MDIIKKIKIIAVTGPTATGKTRLGVGLARRFGGEIVSADSRQVYRGLNIGTGKDLLEYGSGQDAVPYHLIDTQDPHYDYNLMEFQLDATRAILDIHARNKIPFLVGGSPLYVDSLIRNYRLPGGPPNQEQRTGFRTKTIPELLDILMTENPDTFETFKDRSNPTRIIRAIEIARYGRTNTDTPGLDAEWLVIGSLFDRKEIHARIEARLDARLAEGMLDEARTLHANGLGWDRFDYFGLEYRYMARHLQDTITLKERRDSLLAKIRQFARRQDIWFRKMEREGINIYWIKNGDYAEAEQLAETFLADKPLPDPEIKLNDIRYGPKGDRKPPKQKGKGELTMDNG